MKIITRKQALEAWNNPNTKILFEMVFDTFEEYWKECEKFNNASSEEQDKMEKSAVKKLNTINRLIDSINRSKNK